MIPLWSRPVSSSFPPKKAGVTDSIVNSKDRERSRVHYHSLLGIQRSGAQPECALRHKVLPRGYPRGTCIYQISRRISSHWPALPKITCSVHYATRCQGKSRTRGKGRDFFLCQGLRSFDAVREASTPICMVMNQF